MTDIYNNPRVTKGHAYTHATADSRNPSVLSSIDKGVHRRKRQIIGPVVSERSICIFEQKMKEQITMFLHTLYQSSQAENKTTNMSPQCERLAVDIIG